MPIQPSSMQAALGPMAFPFPAQHRREISMWFSV